jgi:hypothetical protein
MNDSGHKNRQTTIKEQPGVYDTPERYEIINGVRYDFLSSPKVVHQLIVGNMHAAFHFSCRMDGVILLSPIDVHFDDGDNIAQPDLIYITNENRAIIRDGFVFGTPDLLVEVLSDSTGRKDKSVKREMYERFGVKEYWIVDPIYRTVDQLVLMEDKYVWMSTSTETDVLQSQLFPCMTVALKEVFPPQDE